MNHKTLEIRTKTVNFPENYTCLKFQFNHKNLIYEKSNIDTQKNLSNFWSQGLSFQKNSKYSETNVII